MFGSKRVMVLGAGPAGLLAAHAAMTKGYEVIVVSRPDKDGKPAKSDLFGCQYLHAYIPGVGQMRDGWVPVKYDVVGPVDGYRAKVYGNGYQGPTSADEYGPEGDHAAWDLRRVYDVLWDHWRSRIVPISLNPLSAQAVFENPGPILVTIPAPAICRDMENHKFSSARIWAMGAREQDQGEREFPYAPPENTVVCNGDRDTSWYRAATVFGYSTLEWPGGNKPPIRGVVPVSKPLSTDCTCWLRVRARRNNVHRLGRFGRWEKGVLVHTAYYDTLKVLS